MKAGRKLGDLHCGYEKVKPWEDCVVDVKAEQGELVRGAEDVAPYPVTGGRALRARRNRYISALSRIMIRALRSTGVPFPSEPEVLSEDPSTYGDWGEKELFGEYRSGIRRYFVSRAVGHHVLRVGSDGVTLDYYGHDARQLIRSFVLR